MPWCSGDIRREWARRIRRAAPSYVKRRSAHRKGAFGVKTSTHPRLAATVCVLMSRRQHTCLSTPTSASMYMQHLQLHKLLPDFDCGFTTHGCWNPCTCTCTCSRKPVCTMIPFCCHILLRACVAASAAHLRLCCRLCPVPRILQLFYYHKLPPVQCTAVHCSTALLENPRSCSIPTKFWSLGVFCCSVQQIVVHRGPTALSQHVAASAG